MSEIVQRVAEKKVKVADAVLTQLGAERMSTMVRRQTWPDHERAEHSPFEQSLVKGTVTLEAHGELMAQMWFVYSALEDRAREFASDPVAGPFLIEDLFRVPALEQDLESLYFGPDWRNEIKPMQVTSEYVDRIRNATPAQYVAHHYTRYMADLSGGQYILDGLRKGHNLDTDGVRFYIFDGIDPDAFKDAYRQALDDIPADEATKRELIEEILVAYEFNVEIALQLGERYAAQPA